MMKSRSYKLKGVSDFQKKMASFQIETEAMKNIRQQLSSIQRVSSQISESIRPLVEITSKFQFQLQPAFRWLKDSKEFEEFCDMHGWVPHTTLKTHVLYPSNETQMSELTVNWPQIRRDLYKDYPATNLEPERRIIFNEILKAYTAEAYSVVRRCSVIEIEGLAADFCSKHDTDNNKRKNYVENAPDYMGKLTPREIGGMLPYKAIKKYSDKIFMGTMSPKFTESDNQAKSINRHSHAHGSRQLADKMDSINSIFLLHHYAKYFALLDKIMIKHSS